MKIYPVLTPLHAGQGKRYGVGETIGLEDKAARELLACKAIGPALEAAAEKTPQRLNVKDTIAAVAAAQTLEALNALAEGEDRTTVLPVIEKRRQELTTPPQ